MRNFGENYFAALWEAPDRQNEIGRTGEPDYRGTAIIAHEG